MSKKKIIIQSLIFGGVYTLTNTIICNYYNIQHWKTNLGFIGFVIAATVIYGIIDEFRWKRKAKRQEKEWVLKIQQIRIDVLDNHKKPVIELEQQTDFHKSYSSKPDADHWATLLPVLERFKSVDVDTEDTSNFDSDQLFLKHMLAAFLDGERFLIAKMRYNG